MLVCRLLCCWRCCSQPPRPMSCLMTSCSCQKVCFLCDVMQLLCQLSLPSLLGCRVRESRVSNTEWCEFDAVIIMQGTLCTMDLVRESCLTSTAWYAFSHACLAHFTGYCLLLDSFCCIFDYFTYVTAVSSHFLLASCWLQPKYTVEHTQPVQMSMQVLGINQGSLFFCRASSCQHARALQTSSRRSPPTKTRHSTGRIQLSPTNLCQWRALRAPSRTQTLAKGTQGICSSRITSRQTNSLIHWSAKSAPSTPAIQLIHRVATQSTSLCVAQQRFSKACCATFINVLCWQRLFSFALFIEAVYAWCDAILIANVSA